MSQYRVLTAKTAAFQRFYFQKVTSLIYFSALRVKIRTLVFWLNQQLVDGSINYSRRIASMIMTTTTENRKHIEKDKQLKGLTKMD